MTALDKRLHAYRDDLADVALKGRVDAALFTEPQLKIVTSHFADIKRTPSDDAPLDTQFLYGTKVHLFEDKKGWSWVQSLKDGYVGYARSNHLAEPDYPATHRVMVPRSFLYPAPDLKTPRCGYLSMGSEITVVGAAETRGTHYAVLASGAAIIANHIVPLGQVAPDYVTMAEQLLHTPYLWGGATGFGIDCSGLVQLSLAMAGHQAPRDTDMQAAKLGEALPKNITIEALERGDLVFWKGHVAIVSGPNQIIHANGHTMSVAIEPLDKAIERIAYLYAKPTAYKRLIG